MATNQLRRGIRSSLLLLSTISLTHGQVITRATRKEPGIDFQKLVGTYTKTYDPGNPSETCYDLLHESDENGDGTLQNYEYVNFIAELSEGDFDVEEYRDLPFALKVNFVYLSCLCQFFPGATGSGCCEGPEGGIDVTAADPNVVVNIDGEDENYLRTVCSETQGAIDFARREEGIPPPPTGSPTARPTPEISEGPTSAPTAAPTQSPTPSPSDEPTPSPSDDPTRSPSAEPTPSPSDEPTRSPSAEPTVNPTSSPSEGPTPTPSVGPTDSPTKSPSKAPSAEPTRFPTTLVPVSLIPTTPVPVDDVPTDAPVGGTGSPTVSPSLPPTKAPISGTRAPVSEAGAPTVSPSPPPTKAPITVTRAPTIPGLVPTTAPIKVPTSVVTSSPSVSLQPSLTTAVSPGAGIEPIPTPPSGNETPEGVEEGEKPDGDRNIGGGEGENESGTLTVGQAVGVALAAAFFAYAAAYVYFNRRKLTRDEDPALEEVANKDLDDLEVGQAVTKDDDDDPENEGRGSGGPGNEPGFDTNRQSETGSDAAVYDRDSSSSERGSDAAVYDGEPYDNPAYIPQAADAASRPASSSIPLISGVPSSPTKGSAKSDSSSAASESGWSSSAGMSSLNTSSFDDRTDDGLLPGSPDRLLATIGMADIVTQTANSTQRDSRPSFVPVDNDNEHSSSNASADSALRSVSSPLEIHSDRPGQSKVSREDLNAAIEAGDWAMVGATAALLADTSNSEHSLSGTEAESTNTSEARVGSTITDSSESSTRAKELDRMVVSGDWEGIVLAAAQFEGESVQKDEETMGSASVGMSIGERSQKDKEELRAEVEKLVRRVVPDEVDNIDEMMLQFEGREEELIETLRTMLERNVAQRARAAFQKTAKLEAKAKASIASGSVSSGPYHRANDSSSMTSSEPSYYGSSTNNSSSASSYTESANSSVSDLDMDSSKYSSSRGTTRSSLELAIEKGDWRAVGEAAAMMGGSSGAIPDSPGESLSSSSSTLGDKAERVYYLDALIAKGDWAGIVAAAGKYQAMDDQMEPGPRTEEEREALAQADWWQTIANQSKQGSSKEAQGASDAADWAISRSLEQKMRGDDGTAAASDAKVRLPDDESV